ncbi:cytochrome P450, partial [Saccharothrix sp. ST-888]|uniref:cytochrome P450 n=1 Tax=Saccharothrix sp. ST-888 TaxID=1427391 RepID=UPI0005EC676F
MIVFSPYLIHHPPDLHPAPQRFDPYRWLPERPHALPRAAYVPYGIGSRPCIGQVYGIPHLTRALAVMLRLW